MTGSFFNSRMINDYVYFVVSQPAYIIYDTVVLPKIYSQDRLVKEIVPSDVHFYNGSDNYYQYTTFVTVNMQNPTEAPTYMTLMLGGTSSMYVSERNMYITFPEFNGNTWVYSRRTSSGIHPGGSPNFCRRNPGNLLRPFRSEPLDMLRQSVKTICPPFDELRVVEFLCYDYVEPCQSHSAISAWPEL